MQRLGGVPLEGVQGHGEIAKAHESFLWMEVECRNDTKDLPNDQDN
jgi:hypothetical protein